MSEEEAKKAIQEHKDMRSNRCALEVAEVLKKYGCHMNIVQVWVNGKPGELSVRFDAV